MATENDIFKNPAAAEIAQFESVLESDAEQAIHSFLAEHAHMFNFLQWDGFVKSKYRLADAFIPDFMSIGLARMSQSPRPLVTFIEIERSTQTLFTRAGDPTAFLTHAIRQVQDWKQWVTNNHGYLKDQLQILIAEELPLDSNSRQPWRRERINEGILYGFDTRYMVIAGRRRSLTVRDRLLLTQMNSDLRDIKIVTFDALLEEMYRKLSRVDGILWADVST